MKISAVKKELSYLLETPIKSAKDLRLAATANTKLAEVMEAWSFINYTEEYSWNTLLIKLVPDNSVITQAKEYLITNWDVKETDLVIGHTYIEIKEGYELTGVIHLTTDNTLTCASFTGVALFEDLMMLVEIVGTGVNGNLSSSCVGDTAVSMNQDELTAIWNYKIIQSSWHPDSYHMWMYEGKKDYWYFTTDKMVAEIKLQDLETKVNELNSLASTKSVTVQSCGTWSNIFTCNDTELEKLLNSQYYQLNRDSIMQKSLTVAEIHSQAIKQQQLVKEWQLEQKSIVVTKCSDNKFKGIPVEHFNHASDAWLSAMGNNLDNSVLISTDTYEGTPLVNINNGGEIVFTSSFLESLKLANHYLATEDEQIKQAIEANIPHQYAAVLGGTTAKQVPSSEPLPGSVVLSSKLCPKLYLFSAITEFVFLMECLRKLLKTMVDSEDKPITIKLSSSLFKLWWSVCNICCKGYVGMPEVIHTKLTAYCN